MADSIYINIDDVTKGTPTKDVAVYKRSGSSGFVRSGTIPRGKRGVVQATPEQIKQDQLAQQQKAQEEEKKKQQAEQLKKDQETRQQKQQDRERAEAVLKKKQNNNPFLLQSSLANVTPPASLSFVKKVIGVEGGVPTTAYYQEASGKKATPEQEAQLRKQESSELRISTQKKSPTIAKVKGAVVGAYEVFEEGLRESITYPIAKATSKGLTKLRSFSNVEVTIKKTPPIIYDKPQGSISTEPNLKSTFGLTAGNKPIYNIRGVQSTEKTYKPFKFLEVLPVNLAEAKSNIKFSSNLIMEKFPKSTTRNVVANVGKYISYGGIGKTEDIIENPGRNLLVYGIGAGIGYGATLLSAGASAVGPTTAKIVDKALIGAGVLAGSYSVGQTLNQVNLATGTYEKSKIVGVALSDIGIIGAGGIAGQKGGQKVVDYFRVKGRVELPLEDYGLVKDFKPTKEAKLVESVDYGLSNKAGVSKQLQDIKVFRRAGRGYQASPVSFSAPEVKIVKGSSEFPGLYTAPNPATYFLKAGENNVQFAGKITGGSTPTLSLIDINKIKFSIRQNPNKVFVTGVKPEIEAVIPEGAYLERIGQRTFFEFQGRKIPVEEFRIKSFPGQKGSSLDIKTPKIRSVSGSSSGFGKSFSYSLITPEVSGFFGLASSKSYKGPSSLKLFSSYGPSSSLKNLYSSLRLKSYSSRSSYSKSLRSTSFLSKSYGSSSSLASSSTSITSSGGSISYSKILTGKKYTSIGFPDIKGGSKKNIGSYRVELRRFGKFKTIGITGDLTKAVNIGRSRASTTLGATFRVKGAGQIRTPTGFYKAKSSPNTFIEKRRFRLSTAGEKIEIKGFKRRKL